MKWDPCLKTVELSKIQLVKRTLSDTQKNQLKGFYDIQSNHPGFTYLTNQEDKETIPNHTWKWAGQQTEPQRGYTAIQIENGSETKTIDAYCKVTHRLDPIRWIRGKYIMPSKTTTKQKKHFVSDTSKLSDAMNQAYVENVVYLMVSYLREHDISPHFPYYYGSFTAIADKYQFNISEDYESYKNMKWFWNGLDKEKFTLKVFSFHDETDSEQKEWTRRPSVLEDDLSDLDSDEEKEDKESEDEELEANGKINESDNASIKSADNLSFHTAKTEDEDLEDEDLSSYNEPHFFMELPHFPVLLMYLEKSDGVMDDLIEDPEQVPAQIGSAEWEVVWSAWLFQIIAALCTLQHTIALTHNDLHTNNIVWSETEEEFLYYKKRDGTTFQVPTFGKIFRIIDFGRAIFKVKNKVMFSDDFKDMNDAATQYNFGPFRDSEKSEVCPNPSFDLCRLAVSMFEGIFPIEPGKKHKGKLLSSEPGLDVYETTSDLFNTMWSWMITDMGENVLITSDGDEKYPNFDLYTVIAQDCHQAKPCDQIEAKPFVNFKVVASSVPEDKKVYSLFF